MEIKSDKGRLSWDVPDLALTEYLNALLSEVESSVEEEAKASSEVRIVSFAPERTGAGQRDVHIPEIPAVAPRQNHSASQEEAADSAQAERHSRLLVPRWAAAPFQCLLVKVSGLKVAIPLVLLNSIAEWDKKTAHLPGQPAWHQGLIEHRGAKVTIVDTALLVMPEKAGEKSVQERLQGASHLLIVGGGRWGLLCDRLLNPILLDPAKVHWRDAKGNRPWMVGTLPEQLCILLDVDVLLDTIGHE